MIEKGLFGDLPQQVAAKREAAPGAPRMWEPERDTIELRASSLDSLIGGDHPARLIWTYVSRLDLRELEVRIKAREGVAGHPAITPRLAGLAKEVDGDPSANEERLRKGRAQRAAERLSGLEAAVAKVAEIEAQRSKSKPQAADEPVVPPASGEDGEPSEPNGSKAPRKAVRASTTDPDARVIKMADGGIRPAYNMQIASVAGEQIVVAVEGSPNRSHRGLAR